MLANARQAQPSAAQHATPSWPIWAQVASLLSSRHWNPSSRSIPLPPPAPSHTGARVRDPRLQLPSTGPCRCHRPPPCLLLSSPLSLFLLSRLRAALAYGSWPRPPPEHELQPAAAPCFAIRRPGGGSVGAGGGLVQAARSHSSLSNFPLPNLSRATVVD